MKMTQFTTGTVLVFSLLFYFTSCSSKQNSKDILLTTGQDTTKQKSHQTTQSTFDGLRNIALSATPEQLGLSLPANKVIVYGVIMDWEMGGAIATTVSYQTGDASLYLSSGGGIIGGGQHQKVNNAAQQFVSLAQTFLNKTKQTKMTALPDAGEVIFHLLTNKGIYVGKDKIKNFENGSSPWLTLFKQGNTVLSELRKTTEK